MAVLLRGIWSAKLEIHFNGYQISQLQCELQRDVGIIDVYRHKEGAPLRGAYPVVVQFKAP